MDTERIILSIVTNIGTFAMIVYLVMSAKEVIIHWMNLTLFRKENDLLGPTALRYHGGRLSPERPIILTTFHAPSAMGPITHRPAVSTMWRSLTRTFLGADRASETT